MNKRFAIGTAITASLMLGAGVAMAAIPDSGTGVFTACVNNNTQFLSDHHSVYLIDKQAGDTCNNGYTEKTWGGAQAAGFDTKVFHSQVTLPADDYHLPGGDDTTWPTLEHRAECPAGRVVVSATTNNAGGPIGYGPESPASPTYASFFFENGANNNPKTIDIYLNCATS